MGFASLRRLPFLKGQEAGLVGVIVVLSVAFSFVNPNFLTTDNLRNVLVAVAVVGIMSIGQCFVIIAREIDLSVGSVMGLSGLGDLILTCSSPQSRNYSYGLALGRGEDLAGRPLAEGVATAPIAAELCVKNGVSAPIIHAVAALLAGKITIDEAVTALLNRPLKTED